MFSSSRFTLLRALPFLAMTLLASSSHTATAASKSGRLGFAQFDARAKNGETLSVVFFGGSLTWGAQASDPQLFSYRARMAQKLEAAYPKAHFRFWDGSIGGTGSRLGAFRLERDVLSRKPDLVFLDFTTNDGAYSVDSEKLASYESLIRRMILADVPVVQVLLAVKKDVLPDAPARMLDVKHKEIAAAYGLPVADSVAYIRAQVAAGKVNPDAVWSVTPDTTHPGDDGYALYAEAVWDAYQAAVRSGVVCQLPEKMLAPETYMTVARKRLTSFGALPEGWKPGSPSRTGVTFDFQPSRWLDEEAVAAMANENGTAPQPLRLRVRAENILLFGEATPATGDYEISIDGGEAKLYHPGKTSTMGSMRGNLRYVETIALGLDASREHIVEITPRLAPGQELRLESLCLAGAPAEAAPDPTHR